MLSMGKAVVIDMKKGKLLFFFSDENCSSCAAVVPTLAALAKAEGIDFESYICSRPWSWQGEVLPFVGHNHLESFYYLANFYDEILYCSITSEPSFQFRREVLAFGGAVISARCNEETAEFYCDVFGFFGRKLPETALILPDRREGERYYAPYCGADIMRIGALGIGWDAWVSGHTLLLDGGVKDVKTLYCASDEIEALDSAADDDTYATVTARIAARNVSEAKQIGFIDPDGLLRWQTYFVRHGVVAMYEDMAWEAFMPTVKKYADMVGNADIIGNQVVWNPAQKMVRNNDAVIAELGKYHLIHNLVGVNPRIGFTVQTEKKLPRDWMDHPAVKTPWDDEYSDEFLKEKLDAGYIPICPLFYAADLGHLPVLTHFLDMMCLDGMRGGIAFPSTWYDYAPELVEQLYLPLSQGGVCPNLEPLLSSVGTAVATEAEGYITPEMLTSLISRARHEIAEHVGARRVPRGIYPFQDASPFYVENSGKPQFEVVETLGFEYYITYRNSAKPARIEYDGDRMTALNQQTPQWFPSAGEPTEFVKKWEQEGIERMTKTGRAEWIVMGFDTPFYGLTPNYLGEIEFEPMRTGWARHALGMRSIYAFMQYVRRTGGDSGRLFLVKPHELYRFAKIAQAENKI